jgi:hypothetical protein
MPKFLSAFALADKLQRLRIYFGTVIGIVLGLTSVGARSRNFLAVTEFWQPGYGGIALVILTAV